MSLKWCGIIVCVLLPLLSFAQKPDKLEQLVQFPSRFLSKLDGKVSKLDAQLQRQAVKYLQRLQQKEKKLQRKLLKIDSAAAKQLAGKSFSEYERLLAKVESAPGRAFNREVYYYTRQLKEYKEILNDPDKLTSTALSMLNKLPVFQETPRTQALKFRVGYSF